MSSITHYIWGTEITEPPIETLERKELLPKKLKSTIVKKNPEKKTISLVTELSNFNIQGLKKFHQKLK